MSLNSESQLLPREDCGFEINIRPLTLACNTAFGNLGNANETRDSYEYILEIGTCLRTKYNKMPIAEMIPSAKFWLLSLYEKGCIVKYNWGK